MKIFLSAITFLQFLFFSLFTNAQITTSSQWTWMKGGNSYDAPGVYGTKGVASAANYPSARNRHTTWSDNDGNFWLFGGFGCSCQDLNVLNDLWKYNPSTNEWTWVSGDSVKNGLGVYGTKGTPSPDNIPRPRSNSASWTDTAGNLWLFGGGQYDFGGLKFNDLWKFDPSISQWTWVSGDSSANQSGVYGVQGTSSATNKPGARTGSASWTDANGNFWLFGGNYIFGFNDLWKYNSITNEWAWMKGNTTESQTPGVFGTMGTPAPANTPGALVGSSSWTDDTGKLFLFGGNLTTNDLFNTLWKYDPLTNNWTWIHGSNTANASNTYGIMGVPAANNTPGSTYGNNKWKDAYGNFWLYGGWSYSDLWKYNVVTNQWTWMKGYQPQSYGTKGIPNEANSPSSRFYSSGWTDTFGNLWLFGGHGSDLWKLSNNSVLPITLTSIKASQQNNYIAVEWKVENEIGMKHYEVEKSTNGLVFSKAGLKSATGNRNSKVNYSFLDVNALSGNTYYRILSTSLNGESKYSQVVKVFIGDAKSGYIVYPNPVTNGVVQLQFTNKEKGKYTLRLHNAFGQVILVDQIEHKAGSSTETLKLGSNIAKGNYFLEVTAPDNSRQSMKIIF